MSRSFTSHSDVIVNILMSNRYGRIEYVWSRYANNISNLQFYFQRIFQKERIVVNFTYSVKWGGFFHLEEREFYLQF